MENLTVAMRLADAQEEAFSDDGNLVHVSKGFSSELEVKGGGGDSLFLSPACSEEKLLA